MRVKRTGCAGPPVWREVAEAAAQCLTSQLRHDLHPLMTAKRLILEALGCPGHDAVVSIEDVRRAHREVSIDLHVSNDHL